MHDRWRRVRAPTTAHAGLIGLVWPSPALWGLLAIMLLLNGGLAVAVIYRTNVRGSTQEEYDHYRRKVRLLETDAARLATGVNLAKQLAQRIDAGAAMTRLQHLAVENNLALVSLSPSKDAPNKEAPGLMRVALEMQLSGSYSAIKAMLAMMLEQSPELWLTRMKLRAAGSGVEAQITVQAWSLDSKGQPGNEVTN